MLILFVLVFFVGLEWEQCYSDHSESYCTAVSAEK